MSVSLHAPSSFKNLLSTTLHLSTPQNDSKNVSLIPYTSTDEFFVLRIFTQVVCVLVLCTGIFGNTLVLIIFGTRLSTIKSFEGYIISLALSDVISTLVLPSFQLYALFDGTFHYLGDTECKTIYFVSITTITVSAITLVVLSVHRCIITKWPRYELYCNLKLLIVLITPWILGSLLAVLNGQIALHEIKDNMVCSITFSSITGYTVYPLVTFAVQCGVPLLVTTLVYTVIRYGLPQPTSNEGSTDHQQDKKAITVYVVMAAVFFTCVIPHNAFYLFNLSEVLVSPVDSIYPIHVLLTTLFMIRTCANPIIYLKWHPWFRQSVRKLFCFCGREKTPKWSRHAKSSLTPSLCEINNQPSPPAGYQHPLQNIQAVGVKRRGTGVSTNSVLAGGTNEVTSPGGNNEVTSPGGTNELTPPGGTNEVTSLGATNEVTSSGGNNEVTSPGGTTENDAAEAGDFYTVEHLQTWETKETYL